MASSRKGERVLLTDTDLFPPGYVELNGFKVLGGFPMERVVAYTATLIRDSGSGLTRLFHDYLRSLGGLMRTAERLCCYEGGGLSANIRGDQVLVGSAAFMNLMEISLPPRPEREKRRVLRHQWRAGRHLCPELLPAGHSLSLFG